MHSMRERELHSIHAKIWECLVGELRIVMIYGDEFVVCFVLCMPAYLCMRRNSYFHFIFHPCRVDENVILRQISLKIFGLNFSYFI